MHGVTSWKLAEATNCLLIDHCMTAKVSGCSLPVALRSCPAPSSMASGKSRFRSLFALQLYATNG